MFTTMDNLDDLLNKIKSNDEISIEDKQQIRTELRQRFLKMITRLQGTYTNIFYRKKLNNFLK